MPLLRCHEWISEEDWAFKDSPWSLSREKRQFQTCISRYFHFCALLWVQDSWNRARREEVDQVEAVWGRDFVMEFAREPVKLVQVRVFRVLEERWCILIKGRWVSARNWVQPWSKATYSQGGWEAESLDDPGAFQSHSRRGAADISPWCCLILLGCWTSRHEPWMLPPRTHALFQYSCSSSLHSAVCMLRSITRK